VPPRGPVQPEHVEHDLLQEPSVVAVHAGPLQERRRLGVGAQVLPDGAGEQPLAVPGEPRGGEVAGRERRLDALGRGDRRPDRQVHAPHGEPRVDGEARGVAHDDHAVGRDLAEHVPAALGDQVRAVLHDLRSPHVARQARVREEALEHVGRRQALRHEVVEPQHDAHGQRGAVRVDDAAAPDALGAVADVRDRGALVAGHPEAVLDHGLRQGQHGLDADREVVGRRGRAQAGLARQERVHPVRRDDDAGAQLVLARLHPDHAPARAGPVVLGEHPVHADAGHEVRAGLLGLGREPRVEPRPQHRDGVHRVGEAVGRDVQPDRRVRREEHDLVAGDAPLVGGVVEVVRDHLLQHARVQHAAGQVLGPGRLAALDHRHGAALPGEQRRGDAPGRTGPDDDDVEVRLGHRSASVRAGTTWYRSPTTA
jgi:hypothetical protein